MLPAVAIGPLLRLAGYALLVAGLFGAGAYWEHGRMQKKLDAKTAEFNQFKGGVIALGEDAKRRAALTEATHARNKERADEENRNRTAAVAAATRRLRLERDDARGRLLSEAGRTPGCPDGKACFDRAELGAAFRVRGEGLERYRAAVLDLAREGAESTIALDAAKGWALKLSREMSGGRTD